jgi:hypothetical protein
MIFQEMYCLVYGDQISFMSRLFQLGYKLVGLELSLEGVLSLLILCHSIVGRLL